MLAEAISKLHTGISTRSSSAPATPTNYIILQVCPPNPSPMCPPPYPCPHAANSRQHRLTCAAGLNTAVSVDFLGFFLEYNHQPWLYDCLLFELRKRISSVFLSATSRRIGGRSRARAGRVGAIGVDAATRRRRLFVLVCGLFCAVLCGLCPWCVWARVGRAPDLLLLLSECVSRRCPHPCPHICMYM